MSRTALIVGAGIGGLAAGVALRRSGWSVRIFERARSPRELGFGLALAPNAMAALRELGLEEIVLTRSFAPARARGEIRRLDGTVLKRAEFPPREALGGPLVIALRPALHGALLEAVGLETIALDTEITGFRATGGGVAVQSATGPVAEGDVLVGADGVASVVRHALHPSEPPPRPCGIVAVRGAVHGALRHLGELTGIYYVGRGVEAFLVRASETGIYWALSLARELIPAEMREPAAILAHMWPALDPTFRAVAAVTDEMRYDELVDRDPLPSWGRCHVTLLGDAAHPMLPHTGQGAAQAIVDAVTLGRLLRSTPDIEAALRHYESERRVRTATLVRQGRRTARLMRTTNGAACYLRERVVRLMPIAAIVKLLVTINRRAGTDVQRSA